MKRLVTGSVSEGVVALASCPVLVMRGERNWPPDRVIVGDDSSEAATRVGDLAANLGEFFGVDEKEYPRDFATFIRYHTELKKITARYPLPGPLALSQLDDFLQETEDRCPVEWA